MMNDYVAMQEAQVLQKIMLVLEVVLISMQWVVQVVYVWV